MLSCSIGLGDPIEHAAVVEQAKHSVKSTLYFGRWENGRKK